MYGLTGRTQRQRETNKERQTEIRDELIWKNEKKRTYKKRIKQHDHRVTIV